MKKAQPVSTLTNKHLFLNRELSLLSFNERVLELAEQRDMPLLERLRYLCIVSSNLDEFYEIRVAGLLEEYRQNPDYLKLDGSTVTQVLQQVTQAVHVLVDKQYGLLNQAVLPALESKSVVVLEPSQWDSAQKQWAKQYFIGQVMPVLTPIGLDPAHPFPRVLNKSLNFIVQLSGKDAFGRMSNTAIVQAPRVLARLIQVKPEFCRHEYTFMLLSSIMEAFIPELFPGMKVHGVHQFRVTRNSDLYVDEEEITNLRQALQGELSQRHYGDAVRLEVSSNCPSVLIDKLLQEFHLTDHALYRVEGPVNLVRLAQLADCIDRVDLKFAPFTPGLPKALSQEVDYFHAIDQGDILLHHPYESFNPVLEFIRLATQDPNVVAIKQTIYRTGKESELMDLLMMASYRGKEVTVVLELMARFDEEANIEWSSRLEQAGVHVVYGVVGLKTHAKMLMVVRREQKKDQDFRLKRYVHLGTGNYHPKTARVYTDFGLFTANQSICQDIHELFNHLTGLGKARQFSTIWCSPFNLHDNVCDAIKQEMAHAKAGKKAHMMARMNSLLEPKIISLMYKASQLGLKIDLIVRGQCALRPGVKGLSENITVRSLVGQFLEHSRVFYFYNQGAEDVFISSADWMQRSFFRRVELAVPILDKKIKNRVIEEALVMMLADNLLAWQSDKNGHYKKLSTGAKKTFNVQKKLLQQLTVDYNDDIK